MNFKNSAPGERKKSPRPLQLMLFLLFFLVIPNVFCIAKFYYYGSSCSTSANLGILIGNGGRTGAFVFVFIQIFILYELGFWLGKAIFNKINFTLSRMLVIKALGWTLGIIAVANILGGGFFVGYSLLSMHHIIKGPPFFILIWIGLIAVSFGLSLLFEFIGLKITSRPKKITALILFIAAAAIFATAESFLLPNSMMYF